ncbi:Peptidoglycan-binding protein [Rubrivivax sp. A210]|uniref:peptidoglycan-binding protein n=1 Tax=Rubrivivax sp. A210 TaxID=2772301 RepID=UPI0019182032|nr:peptidoglycan-binding protein [Rubrivivax sp. A210]CAD5373251.1 Peptidoglycan-binding protein [Rubrivivax sp. A210]
MAALTGSVGQGGRNAPADVTQVQTLLAAKGGDPGAADGQCGERTIAAIRKFQAGFMALPDGLISPGGGTWRKLTDANTATLVQWSGDSAQWPEDKKLRSMHPQLSQKVQAVLVALRDAGFQPKVYYGWRSVEVQQRLFLAGNSKVRFSFHNVQKPDGTPLSHAADIIDARYAWSPQAESSGFWQALGAAAKKEGLIWGGDWVSFRDWAHVQLVDNGELARLKRESGL